MCGIAVAGGVVGVWLGPRAAAAAAVAMVALAFVGRTAFEREAAVVRTIAAFLALRQTPLRARASLRRRRVALAVVLERVQQWLDQEPEATEE